MTMNGIDISKWQSGIDLSAVKADFVIVKATEGIGYVDKSCDGFFQKALSLGKKLGFYHFARPTVNNDPIREADFFYENCKGYFGKAIPILDWESENKHNVAYAKKWLDRVYERSGVKPVIYMSESVANAYDWSSVANADYGLWVAKYRDNNPDYNYNMANAGSRPRVKWWKFYCMWQWTSSGRLDAFAAHNVGMNFLTLAFSFGDGMQVAAVALIGRSLGEKNPEKAKAYGNTCQLIGFFISLILAVILFFFGRELFGLFFTQEDILNDGVLISRFIMVIVLFQISQIIFGGCLRGAGDVKYTLVASLISVTLIRSIVTYVLVSLIPLGLVGIWIGVLSDQLSRFILLGIRFKKGQWVQYQI